MRMACVAGPALALLLLLSACSTATVGSRAGQPPGAGPGAGAGAGTAPTQAPAPGPVAPPPVAPAPAPATTVTVERRYADGWRLIDWLDNHVPPGPAELRLHFSKPVRQQEVQLALTAAQAAPVRGAMHWEGERTLIWSITSLPPRLDFLLGGAHDQDSLPLPGGMPCLYTGEPAYLVAVETSTGAETRLIPLPADVVSAEPSSDGKAINLMIWTPGTSRWDWQAADYSWEIGAHAIKPGRVEGLQPRVAGDLENWAVSRRSGFVAGLKTARQPDGTDTYKAALVVLDPRGGREQVYREFLDRYLSPRAGDYTSHLAWDGVGQRVAGLSHRGGGGPAPGPAGPAPGPAGPAPGPAGPAPGAPAADLVALDIVSGERSVLVENLPVPASATRLAWSPDSRYLLAGNQLVDLQRHTYRTLPGSSAARGAWAPPGDRLLYGEDWSPAFLVDPAADSPRPLGPALIAGWGADNHLYLIRWPASNARYTPPGSAKM